MLAVTTKVIDATNAIKKKVRRPETNRDGAQLFSKYAKRLKKTVAKIRALPITKLYLTLGDHGSLSAVAHRAG